MHMHSFQGVKRNRYHALMDQLMYNRAFRGSLQPNPPGAVNSLMEMKLSLDGSLTKGKYKTASYKKCCSSIILRFSDKALTLAKFHTR